MRICAGAISNDRPYRDLIEAGSILLSRLGSSHPGPSHRSFHAPAHRLRTAALTPLELNAPHVQRLIASQSSDQIVVEIAREICSNFLDERRPTRRHDLIVRFEITDLLSEMETRGLCKASPDRGKYLPSSGSFALLQPDDDFYQKAEAAFVASVRLLRHLFRTGSAGASYPAEALLEKTAEAGVQLDAEGLALGLYLCQDFGILTPLRVSEDRMRVESCGIGEHVINLKEPGRDWAQRARFAREDVSSLN